ncbi:MAG: DUF2933 domain-containing protein [Gemmatimonadota bacterium]
MEWLSQNGFFVLLALAFIAIHLFGHGGHGGHGRSRSAGNRDDTEGVHDHGNSPRRAAPSQDTEPSGRHRHGG